jgi:transcriptional regulator with XRE-family HTH domain
MNICGKLIKHARNAANMTQEQLAAKLQLDGIILSRVQISKIEKGYRYITDQELAGFVRILGKNLLHDYWTEINKGGDEQLYRSRDKKTSNVAERDKFE